MLKVLMGLILGILLAGGLVWTLMPKLMLQEKVSPYSVEETVEKIKERALAQGWVVPSIKPLHQSIKKNGGGELPPVMLVNLCNAHHAFKILNEDANKKISVFMPCTISVYKKSDGQVYVGYMNAALMGKMFGGTVAEVMSLVSDEQQSFIRF